MLANRYGGILVLVARKKNAAAVALGKLGGRARAQALTPEERSSQASKAARKRTRSMTSAERTELARKAAQARWAKKK